MKTLIKKTLSPFLLGAVLLLLQGCITTAVVTTAAVAGKVATDPRSAGTQVDDEILEEKVPGRIRVPQADIVFYAAVRADAVKHGEDVQEYYKKLTTSEKDGPDITV